MDTAQSNHKNIIMLALIAMIVVYTAVSVYGVIRDIGTGETVFVISSSLPRTQDVDRVSPFMDRIKGFFYPPAKVIVPVERKVTIKGRVVYTNGMPYANGLVQLKSDLRITYTDSDGYFIFENVEDGEHTISVLNASYQILASSTVSINRNIEIADAVLVKMDADTFVLEVAVDVKVLQIVLEIQRDINGQIVGNLIINPVVTVLERYLPGEVPVPPTEGDKPTPPVVPIPPPDQPIPPEKPVVPDVPLPPPPGSGGGKGGSTPVVPDGALTVYSSVGGTNFGKAPAPAAHINIFGSGKRIAPGMSGLYKFTVDNTSNPFAIYYDIDLVETNNSLNIPMKYRLLNNKTNSYVNGDSNWHSTAEIRAITANLAAPLTMTDSMKTEYSLEWFWDDGGLIDNSFAENHAGKVACTLEIRVTAQRK